VFVAKRSVQALQPLALNTAPVSQPLARKSVVPSAPLEPRHERLNVFGVKSNELVSPQQGSSSEQAFVSLVLKNVSALQHPALNNVVELLHRVLNREQGLLHRVWNNELASVQPEQKLD
jgi:hypothetical protein